MQVLETLKKKQLITNLQKCEFGKTSLIYIGHIIKGGELRVDLENIETITQWPIPTSMTEARSFMGETQYLRKFIINFSTKTTPLHFLIANGKSFQWENNNEENLNI
jgi:hypothetical protein